MKPINFKDCTSVFQITAIQNTFEKNSTVLSTLQVVAVTVVVVVVLLTANAMDAPLTIDEWVQK